MYVGVFQTPGGVTGGTAGTLWLTTDDGATWTPKASPASVFSGIINLAVDPDQPNILVAATLDESSLYKSSDGAASWTQTASPDFPPPPGPSFLADTYFPFVLVRHSCSPAGGLFAIGGAFPLGYPSVAFSPNFGVTWTTPRLTGVTSVASGPGCTFYVTRTASSDAFVAKLGPDGNTLWATFLGGSDQDAAVALTLDARGNVYVAGNTSSPDFPISVPNIGPPGEDSVFLVKFSPDGTLIYSATLGGEASSNAIALAVDASQNTYIAGTTSSIRFAGVEGAISVSTGSSGFFAKLSADATLNYATYLGGGTAFPSAVLVDANEEPILAGSGQAPGEPAGTGRGAGLRGRLETTPNSS